MSQIKAEINGRDEVTYSLEKGVRAVGCRKLMKTVLTLKEKFGEDPELWPLQDSTSHEALLINELILKSQNNYKLPYSEEEICHCRGITTDAVAQAIKAGAHSIEAVRAVTDANTACGTCGPDCESVLKFILRK